MRCGFEGCGGEVREPTREVTEHSDISGRPRRWTTDSGRCQRCGMLTVRPVASEALGDPWASYRHAAM